MATTRRALLNEIQRVFSTTTGAGGTSWGKVLKTNIAGLEFKGKNVLGILEGPETYFDVVSPDKRDRELDIELQSRCYVTMGTDLNDAAHEILADMEDIVEANERWADNAMRTRLQSNIIDIEASGDRVVEISLFIQVRYRTKRSDPRS